MAAHDGYVLGIDFGLKHIGIAVGQTVTRTANGLTTLQARNGRPNWSEVDQLVAQYRPIALVVGLPLNMDGSGSDMSERADTFARHVARHTLLPTYLADERLSSWAVKDNQGLSADIHARSACLIAQAYLSDPSVCQRVERESDLPVQPP